MRGLKNHDDHRRHPRYRGVTLIELMLAMAITAVTAVAVTAMLSATSYGADASRDLRELVVRSKTLSSRMNETVRLSDRILAADDGYLVLWADTNGDGKPSLHELHRLQLDEATNELRSHTAADNAPDTEWPLDADFKAITDSLMTGSSFPARRWASDVAAWQVKLDETEPRDARLVNYRLTLEAGVLSDSTVNAASLRNR